MWSETQFVSLSPVHFRATPLHKKRHFTWFSRKPDPYGCKGVLLDRLRESLQQNSAEPESSRPDVTTLTPGSNQPISEDNALSL